MKLVNIGLKVKDDDCPSTIVIDDEGNYVDYEQNL